MLTECSLFYSLSCLVADCGSISVLVDDTLNDTELVSFHIYVKCLYQLEKVNGQTFAC